MRIALTVVTALVLAVSASAMGGARDAAAPNRATLRLVDRAPLKLLGKGFQARERVRVTVSVRRRTAKRVIASPAGTFVVAFADVSVDRCSGLTAVAVGARGSRASLKLPQPQCPPRL
jgi:hypothetical protein